MSNGWISLHRDIQDHWLFNFKEPEKALAWIDLIMMANHTEKKFVIRGKTLICSRGQIAISQLKLQKRWRFSQNKLKRFLLLLKKESMINFHADSSLTVITICNYERHQSDTLGKVKQKTPKNGRAHGRPHGRADGRADERTGELGIPVFDEYGERADERTDDSETDVPTDDPTDVPRTTYNKSTLGTLNKGIKKQVNKKHICQKKISIEEEIFNFWKITLKHPKAKFLDSRKKLIAKALKNYEPDDLKLAITGCSKTPWNIGKNPEGTRHVGLDLIFRNENNIERFMSNAALFKQETSEESANRMANEVLEMRRARENYKPQPQEKTVEGIRL